MTKDLERIWRYPLEEFAKVIGNDSSAVVLYTLSAKISGVHIISENK